MPESKKRKKVIERERAQARNKMTHRATTPETLRSPKWWAPLMVGLMVLGLIIVVMAYVTAQSGLQLPIPGAGNWNLLLGIGLMISGFLMTMGWK